MESHRTACSTLRLEHHGSARHAGAVFSLTYHLVFCPKYRQKVLTGPGETRLKAWVSAKAERTTLAINALYTPGAIGNVTNWTGDNG